MPPYYFGNNMSRIWDSDGRRYTNNLKEGTLDTSELDAISQGLPLPGSTVAQPVESNTPPIVIRDVWNEHRIPPTVPIPRDFASQNEGPDWGRMLVNIVGGIAHAMRNPSPPVTCLMIRHFGRNQRRPIRLHPSPQCSPFALPWCPRPTRFYRTRCTTPWKA